MTSVLICDDRAEVRRALAQHLAMPGPFASPVDITGVPDGFALLDALDGTSPDLVLVGIHSASTTGAEAVNLVQAMRPLTTPIIYGALIDIDQLAAAQVRIGGGLLVWQPPGPGRVAQQRWTRRPPTKEERMADLPDVEEIGEILAFIQTRDPATTTVEQFDRDHGVLLDSQAEVAEAVMRELPDNYRDDLRALLGRIQDAIVNNRSQREAAFANQ